MRGIATALALVGLVAGTAAAEEPQLPDVDALAPALPMLRFDPFSPPLLGSQDANPQQAATGPARGAWAPVLTGVVAAGARSIANLNGVILSVGEEANGYRLLEVRPGEAVFEREGRQLVLSVVPDDAPSGEPQ